MQTFAEQPEAARNGKKALLKPNREYRVTARLYESEIEIKRESERMIYTGEKEQSTSM